MSAKIKFKGFNPGSHVLITERRLPHWLQPGATYFITFRLADSVPQPLIRRWKEERAIWLKWHPPPWTQAEEQEYQERFPKRMEVWMDAGMGSCHLRKPNIRHFVSQHFSRFNSERYELDCFVLMPNHVHALIVPRGDQDLFDILQGIKGCSSRSCNRALGVSRRTFWMEDSYNRIVRDWEELSIFREYIRRNPSEAKLRSDEFTLEDYNVLCQ